MTQPLNGIQGNVPSALAGAEGPIAAPAPRARPKMTQAEVKARQGQSSVPTPAPLPAPSPTPETAREQGQAQTETLLNTKPAPDAQANGADAKKEPWPGFPKTKTVAHEVVNRLSEAIADGAMRVRSGRDSFGKKESAEKRAQTRSSVERTQEKLRQVLAAYPDLERAGHYRRQIQPDYLDLQAPSKKPAPAKPKGKGKAAPTQASPAPTVPVHTTPEGTTEPLTPAVVNEALAESIPNRVSAKEKARTIAAHVAEVLKKIDAATQTAFQEEGELRQAANHLPGKDALLHQQQQMEREEKAAANRISQQLVAGLQDLHKHYSARLHSEQYAAQKNQRSVDADTQEAFDTVHRLYQQAKATKTDAERWTFYQQNAPAIEKALLLTGVSSYIADPLRSAVNTWQGTQKGLQRIANALPTASDIKTIVSIAVPGDGVFTVPNTVPALKGLRAKIEKSPLFTKGQLADLNRKPPTVSAKSTPASTAILAMTRDKDGSQAENVANAWNLALAREVDVLISPTGSEKMGFAGAQWKNFFTQNVPVLYVDQRPVDTSRYPALSSLGPVVVAQASTPSGTHWDVLQGETGVTLAMSGKTPEAVIANLEKNLKEKSAAQVQAAFKQKLDKLAEGLGVKATGPAVKAGLEARMTEWVEQVQNPEPTPKTPPKPKPKTKTVPSLSEQATADELRQARKDRQIDTPTLIQRLAHQVVKNQIPIGQLFTRLQAFDDWSEGEVAMALREAGMAPAQLNALGYDDTENAPQRFATASTPAAVTDSLKTLAGNATVQALIDGGTLRVVSRQAQLPASIVIPAGQRVAGAVDSPTGVVYLVAEHIQPDDIKGFLTHEVGVHQAQLGLDQPKSRSLRLAHALVRLVGARSLLGEPTFNDALAQLQRMQATSKPVQAAYAAAKKAMGKLNQNPDLLHEEALAYLVQNHPQTSLAQKIIAAVRAFLYKAGLRINLTENDLQALAVAALRGMARGRNLRGTISQGVMGRNAQDVEAQRQYDAVVARYTNPDGSKKAGWLKAPNGQPTKLTERQWVQVRTENFKRWFGDWKNDPINASKVLDENGEPRIVYHGTDNDFTAFSLKKIGSATDEGQLGRGFYFSTDPRIIGIGQNTVGMPVFLNVRDPVQVTMPDFKTDKRSLLPQGVGNHDGVILDYTPTGYTALEIMVRSSTQIKSAIGNTGAFSPDNPDLRFAYSLGQAESNLTAEEVLKRIEAGGEVTADEFALLQAYLSGATSAATGLDAPTFKTWFGASRIKGKTGQPLKMYHGTMTDFNVFDARKSGASTRHPTAALGFFFTNDRAHAAEKYGDQVMEVYLAVEKPYLMTDADLRRIDTFEDAQAFRQRLEAQGYDGVVMPAETKTRYVVAFHPDQIKRTTNETYTRGEADTRFALASTRPYTPEQQAAMDKIGRRDPQSWGQRFAGLRERIGLKLRQAVADHHAALLDLDRQAYGAGVVENDTAASSWVKARLSRSVDGPMHLLLHEAGLKMDADGALDVLPTVKGLQPVLAPLGAEVDDFLKWVAGNRAERLMQEGRENLFTPDDIAALKALNRGTMADGRNRATVYALESGLILPPDVYTEQGQPRWPVATLAAFWGQTPLIGRGLYAIC